MIKDRKLIVKDLGLMPYPVAWQHQKEMVSARKQNPQLGDLLILTEHPPVYTLGTGSQTKFVHFDLAAPAYEVHRIERGGEVTYHCPGQLVGYPILNLSYHHKDLHWYLRQLEDVLIRTLAHYKLPGQRIQGLTGVWVNDYKVAAIGIKVSRWITMHGFSLNICPDLSGFQRITPCGIAHKPVGTMAQFLPGITMDEVKPILVKHFAQAFNLLPTEQI
ncbi:lipoyl(octanoyl) transferase LipB [Leptothoe sp. PORK10 BA2]|uniref:lipoyl(octanoyl) transferase LipB n=1 Tax=Leptothoe sp. PORK10 BA2 TaxID=3110254 RepID=UPI002B1F2380|nr:lipoyl(octanoyl) transferase LipB [Leptothoe sp. PORK10 BA2]MEA5466084.1 lipoyl(octanoyl) transferase LipB [Leptothoe sp. PORK10 BA2]